MTKILFVCHGNICRSPMAEYVFKDMVRKAGAEDQFYIASAAVSTEEIGNPVHRGTQRILAKHNIPCPPRRATRMELQDGNKYDYILGMDRHNMSWIWSILGNPGKERADKGLLTVKLLLDYTDTPGSISDPWYTGDFETTYRDVVKGCEGLLKWLQK